MRVKECSKSLTIIFDSINEIGMLTQNVKELNAKENITQEMHILSKDVEKYFQNIISIESEGIMEQVL